MEARFGPGGLVCQPPSIRGRGGCSARDIRDWLPVGTRKDDIMPIRLRVTGIPKARLDPSHGPKSELRGWFQPGRKEKGRLTFVILQLR